MSSSPDIISAISNPPFLTYEQLLYYKPKNTKITTFLQSPTQNIAFFLGSSGSGKSYLTLSYINTLSLKYTILQPSFLSTTLSSTAITSPLQHFFTTTLPLIHPQQIIICRQFFKPTHKNCFLFHQHMKDFKGKIIFILNNSQYSYRNIQKFLRIKNDRRIIELENAVFHEFMGYNKLEMRNIVNIFCKKNKCKFTYNNQILNELTDLYEGDSRKILNQLYLRTKSNINEEISPDFNLSKVSIFHFLGKLLYNKRLVTPAIHNKQKQTKKCVLGEYRQMTTEQLLKFDPPYYFNPVELMKQSNLPFQIILGFLSQNYRKFYSSLPDNIRFGTLLSHLYLQKNKHESNHRQNQNWKIEQEFDNLKYILLSHGVMIYNLHAEKAKGLIYLHGPKTWQYNKDSRVKYELLERNIPELSMREMEELNEIGRWFPGKDFVLVEMIGKICGLNSRREGRDFNQHEQTTGFHTEENFNRRAKIERRGGFQDYDEISSDEG